MKYNYLFVITGLILLLMLSFVSADLGVFNSGSCVQLKTILNASNVNLSSVTFPNSSTLYVNSPMTKQGLTFNYSFCNTYFTGKYLYDYYDNNGNVYVNSFVIEKHGSGLLNFDFNNTFVLVMTILISIASGIALFFSFTRLYGSIVLLLLGITLIFSGYIIFGFLFVFVGVVGSSIN